MYTLGPNLIKTANEEKDLEIIVHESLKSSCQLLKQLSLPIKH